MKGKLLPLVLLAFIALLASALAEKPEPLYVREFPRTDSGLPGWMQLKRIEVYGVEVLGMKQAVIVLRFYDKLPDSVRYNFIILFDADRNPKTGARYDEKGAEYRLEIMGHPMGMTGRIISWNAERERWEYDKGLGVSGMKVDGDGIGMTIPLKVIGSFANLENLIVKVYVHVSYSQEFKLRE